VRSGRKQGSRTSLAEICLHFGAKHVGVDILVRPAVRSIAASRPCPGEHRSPAGTRVSRAYVISRGEYGRLVW